MGGLVCRSLLQRAYPKGTAQNYVDKLFTYGTPHGGIHFVDGGGLEKVRDLLGVNNSDDFGRERMYAYLTPADDLQKAPPDTFDETVIPSEAFDTQRVFCVVGTNAAAPSSTHQFVQGSVTYVANFVDHPEQCAPRCPARPAAGPA